MLNSEKRELKEYCKEGLSYDRIRNLVNCSNSTIKKYMAVFSPKEKTDD